MGVDGCEIGRLPELFEVGDRCCTVGSVSIREEQDPRSEVVTDASPCTFLLVTETSVDHHIKVAGWNFEGWLTSSSTAFGKPALMLLPEGRSHRGLDNQNESMRQLIARSFEVGKEYTVKSEATVRVTESLQSAFVTELPPGVTVKLLEHSVNELRRARVQIGSLEGWLSLVTRKGELLLDAESSVSEQRSLASNVCRWLRRGSGILIDGFSTPTPLEESFAFSAIENFRQHKQWRHLCVSRLASFPFGMACDPSKADLDETCCICLLDFTVGEKVKRLPCEHLYHAACIDKWLDKHDSCPLRCREDIMSVARRGGA